MYIWRAMMDAKTCPTCRSLNGLADGIRWSNALGAELDLWRRDDAGRWARALTGGLIGRPPLHPNCRCSIEQQPEEPRQRPR